MQRCPYFRLLCVISKESADAGVVGGTLFCKCLILRRESHNNTVISFRQVIDYTVDVRLGILRAVEVELPVGGNMQGVRHADMEVKQLMECTVLVDPDYLIYGNNSYSVSGYFYEEMLCNKHILRGKLRQG